MVITADRGVVDFLARVRFMLLALATVVVAHEAVHALKSGGGVFTGRMLDGVHEGWWGVTSAVALAGGAALALAALARLALLSRRTHRSGPSRHARGYLHELRILWPRLLAVAAVAFVLQESIEHFVVEGRLPTLAAVIAEQALALPIIAAATFVIAAVGALVRWRIAVAVLRLGAATARRDRPAGAPAAVGWRITAAIVAHGRLEASIDRGRAPPLARLSTID